MLLKLGPCIAYLEETNAVLVISLVLCWAVSILSDNSKQVNLIHQLSSPYTGVDNSNGYWA
jgi:hypothetical protein